MNRLPAIISLLMVAICSSAPLVAEMEPKPEWPKWSQEGPKNLNEELLDAVKYNNYEAVVKLINEGADINYHDGKLSVLHYALINPRIFDELMLHSPNIEIRARDGETPLIISAAFKSSYILEKLLQAGAQINAQDDDGFTALFSAVQENNFENVRQLLKFKNRLGETAVSIDAQNTSNMWSALHSAAFRGHYKIAQLLVNYGANVHLKTRDGYTPLDIAVERKNSDIADLLVDSGAWRNFNYFYKRHPLTSVTVMLTAVLAWHIIPFVYKKYRSNVSAQHEYNESLNHRLFFQLVDQQKRRNGPL